jgi:hypothetical protein
MTNGLCSLLACQYGNLDTQEGRLALSCGQEIAEPAVMPGGYAVGKPCAQRSTSGVTAIALNSGCFSSTPATI